METEVVNVYLVLLCLKAQFLLYLLNYLYLRPQAVSLLPFQLHPPSHGGRVSKRLCEAELLAGVKPQHRSIQIPDTTLLNGCPDAEFCLKPL